MVLDFLASFNYVMLFEWCEIIDIDKRCLSSFQISSKIKCTTVIKTDKRHLIFERILISIK